MPVSEMIDYVVEAHFSIYTAEVRTVLNRHYMPCFVDLTLPREVFDELVQECGEQIMSPSGDDAKDVYHYANEMEEWDGDIDGYYEATKRCLHEALELREQLTSMPTEELQALYDIARLAMTDKLLSQRQQREIDAFFHHAEAAADYQYWSAIPVLTPDEGTALSFGKDPRAVNSDALSAYLEEDSPFAQQYADRLRHVERAFESGMLKTPIRTEAFATWAEKNVVGSDGFTAWCQSFLVGPDEPAREEEIGLSVSKLLVGMAMQKYGFPKDYSPGSGTDAFQKIVDDLARVRLGIDVKSVRKHLVEANRRLHERGDFKG